MEQNFFKGLKLLFRNNLEFINETDKSHIVSVFGKEFSINKEELSILYENYYKLVVQEELSIYNGNYYECLVEINGPFLYNDEIVTNDSRNNIEYRLGVVSDEYIIYIIEKVLTASPNYIRRLNFMTGRARDVVDEGKSFFDLVRIMLKRLTTLKIITLSESSINEYKTRMDGFFFNISFNTGISINKVNYIEEFFGAYVRGI